MDSQRTRKHKSWTEVAWNGLCFDIRLKACISQLGPHTLTSSLLLVVIFHWIFSSWAHVRSCLLTNSARILSVWLWKPVALTSYKHTIYEWIHPPDNFPWRAFHTEREKTLVIHLFCKTIMILSRSLHEKYSQRPCQRYWWVRHGVLSVGGRQVGWEGVIVTGGDDRRRLEHRNLIDWLIEYGLTSMKPSKDYTRLHRWSL